MRIVKAPLRVSLWGGGTDLPEYYEQFGSTIISFAIDRYIYLIHNGRPTGGCRLTYGEVEEVCSLTTVQHTLIRSAAEVYGFDEPCTLSIVSDVPKGTGLGSSSALSVAICKMVYACQNGQYNLATTAYHLERLTSPVGAQDHLPPAFGGFNVYHIEKDRIGYRSVPPHVRAMVETNGLLLYTGRTRKADDILPSWKKDVDALHEIKRLADGVEKELPTMTCWDMASRLRETWEVKRSISGVIDDELNAQYDAAILAGALGGKLLGAGAGGCWFFLVPRGERKAVVEALSLPEIPFRIPSSGCREYEI